MKVLEPVTNKVPVTSIVPLTLVSMGPDAEPVMVRPVPSEPVVERAPLNSAGEPPTIYPSTFKFPATCNTS